MFRSGNWDAADIEYAGINYGFAAFPAYPGGETYINGGGDPAYAISSASTPEKQEAAKTFVEWLGSADGVKLLSNPPDWRTRTGACGASHELARGTGRERAARPPRRPPAEERAALS